MNGSSRLAMLAGAAIFVVLVVGCLVYFGGSGPSVGGGVGPAPSPTPTARLSASPRATSADPREAPWGAYHSDRYQFDIGYPADWTVFPAERTWDAAVDARDALSPAHESFRAPDDSIRVSAWVVPADPSTVKTAADFGVWVETFCSSTDIVLCAGITERAVPLCREKRDCHPSGFLVPFDNETVAFLTGNDFGPGESWVPRGMLVVALWRPESDPSVAPYGGAQGLLEDFLATMDVWPEASPFGERVPPPMATPSP